MVSACGMAGPKPFGPSAPETCPGRFPSTLHPLALVGAAVGSGGSGTRPASLMAGPSPWRRPSQARPGWLLGVESGCPLRSGWCGRVQVQDQGAALRAWGRGQGCRSPLCLHLWVSFTLPPLLTSSSRLEASTRAGVLGSGLWSRCGAVGACPGRPSLGSLCTCLARPSMVTCPPRALGHLTTAHPRGSGPRQLQVTSLVLAEASPLSAGF